MKVNSEDNFKELFDKVVNTQLPDKRQSQVVKKSQEDLERDILSTGTICNTTGDNPIELLR